MSTCFGEDEVGISIENSLLALISEENIDHNSEKKYYSTQLMRRRKLLAESYVKQGHDFKTLSQAELRYSNNEREAFAVVLEVKCIRQFLACRIIMLDSDHRPLDYIFAQNKEVPIT